MDLAFAALLVAGGFTALVYGADSLVRGGTTIASRLGVSTLVIGLTLVAWGTSAPEVVVSGWAAWRGHAEMSLGNVLGSNIANLGLVLGACSLALPAVLQHRLRARELFWLFASLGLLWLVLRDASVTRPEGLLLLAAFAVHTLHVLATARPYADEGEPDTGVARPWTRVLLGTLLLAVGARMVVHGGVLGALHLGISNRVVGLVVFALGTSLPELFAGLAGARRGETDISLGNVVGSNVFNALVVIGVVALIAPGAGPDHPDPDVRRALVRDLPVVLGFSAGVALLPWLFRDQGGRLKGATALGAYLAYVATLLAAT